MLEHLNHPFLCNLRYSFQDIEYLYGPGASFWPKDIELTMADILSSIL